VSTEPGNDVTASNDVTAVPLPSLESLRKFVVVAEELSFTRAARHAVDRHDDLDRLRRCPGGAWPVPCDPPRRARAVTDGTLDLAVLSVPGQPPPGLAVRQLAEEPLVLICAPGHPLASASEVTLDALGGETFIDFPVGWGTRTILDRAFGAAGIDRQVTFEVAYYTTAADLVGNGLGVAFLPESAAAGFEGVVPVPVPGLAWQIQVATAAGRRPSAAARAFLGYLLQR
jgi:DNA-binding transcriptional LysR family regulator